MQASSETHSVTDTLSAPSVDVLLKTVMESLDSNKAEDIVSIDLAGKSGIADHIVIANGRSPRQVAALADYVIKDLKNVGHKNLIIQGLEQSDWVLIDAADIVIHIFRPEVRSFYNLDKMWGAELEDGDVVN
ncbi:ribosome silencing factor [Kordiimonas pumila]|uniref:Ribosomal silencing factor RsfS n=1 Tax=Kordiimonas pumila TaxID=2161677 RepID=A0ABV7D7S6_9PROT|nr:ribosome silencing factor [Kordiimonas pumila]